jgi:hypothetical protein
MDWGRHQGATWPEQPSSAEAQPHGVAASVLSCLVVLVCYTMDIVLVCCSEILRSGVFHRGQGGRRSTQTADARIRAAARRLDEKCVCMHLVVVCMHVLYFRDYQTSICLTTHLRCCDDHADAVQAAPRAVAIADGDMQARQRIGHAQVASTVPKKRDRELNGSGANCTLCQGALSPCTKLWHHLLRFCPAPRTIFPCHAADYGGGQASKL